MLSPHPKGSSADSDVSVALIARDNDRRRAVTKAICDAQGSVVREFSDFPNENMLSKVVDGGCEVIIVDLDQDPEPGLTLIEDIVHMHAAITVMTCSVRNEADVVIRSMQAGAREFLVMPLSAPALPEAFRRAKARRQMRIPSEREAGKIIVFQGTKGGAGVTTLSTNFAVALSKDRGGETVLVDLHPQLGEIALGLGLVPQFSVVDAMSNAGRLDSEFLATLLVRHDSGLMVLASSDAYGTHRSLERGAEKLLRILRAQFSFVVVDAGSCSGNIPDVLFDMADTVYLVTQANLSALRNARRLISYFAAKENRCSLELVLNRFNSRMVEIDGESTIKALGRAVDWKIPNDYPGVSGAQNLGVPLVDQNSAISRCVRQMAKAACGSAVNEGERKLSAAASKGEKWKFWTSTNTKPAFTARF